MQYSFLGKTDVGLVRQANEDSIGHQDMPWGKVIVLCDGMGGHRGGATASGIAVRCILEYFNTTEFQSVPSALDNAISFANEQIFASALDDPDLKGMGTTCVVVVVKGEEIWIAHVGDSRAYLYHSNTLYRLTRDHSFVQNLVDSGVITDDEAESHPRKNELLAALGIRAEVSVEVTQDPILLSKGDLLLICSDGLNGMITNAELAKLMIPDQELEDKCDSLIAAAKSGGGTDNISVQLLKIEQSSHKKSRFAPILPPADQATTNPGIAPGASSEPPPGRAGFNPIYLYVLIGLAVLVGAFFLYRMVLSPAGKEKNPGEVASGRIIRTACFFKWGLKGFECVEELNGIYSSGKCLFGENNGTKCLTDLMNSDCECKPKSPPPETEKDKKPDNKTPKEVLPGKPKKEGKTTKEEAKSGNKVDPKPGSE